jgi:hypothetical protein
MPNKEIVANSGEILGRVYIFPISEENLLAQGHESYWFAIDRRGEGKMNGGSIDSDGQWSFFSPGEVIPGEQRWSDTEAIAQCLVLPKEEFKLVDVPSVGRKTLSESDKKIKSKEDSVKLKVSKLSAVNNSVESLFELESFPVMSARESVELDTPVSEGKEEDLKIESEADSNNNLAERKLSPTEEAIERRALSEMREVMERDLAAMMVLGHERGMLKFDSSERQNLWLLELSPDDSTLLLRSRDDGHVIMAVEAQGGEIVSPMSEVDAQMLLDLSSPRSLSDEKEATQQQQEEEEEEKNKSWQQEISIPLRQSDLEPEESVVHSNNGKEVHEQGFGLD